MLIPTSPFSRCIINKFMENHRGGDHKFYLASICAFNLGAMVLVFGLDWLGWLMITSSAFLWFKGIKHNP